MRRSALALLALLAVTAGCIGASDDEVAPETAEDDQPNATAITPVQERSERDFTITEDEPSQTLEEGPYEPLIPGEPVQVQVDLPATEGTGAATDRASVHMGVFLPDIPGCDWDDWSVSAEDGVVNIDEDVSDTEQDVPERCKVPVVADVGPYYSTSEDRAPLTGGSEGLQLEGDSVATEPSARLGGFLIDRLVPHGYAVAQVSVFGTGDSTHCMDLMGESEQAGIDAAVEFLGEAGFSNGNVGLTGRSYDGTTPWEAASTPAANDHLETIVPISGLTGQHELMWRNGTSELRGGTGVLWGLYYSFAVDGYVDDVDHVFCKDALQGGPQAWAAYVTGDRVVPQVNDYWVERGGFLDAAIENYNGSVYLIHGMQDWNVDPHMAFPAFEELQQAGLETKGLFGQWAHNYPDRLEEHEGCDGRPDWCSAPTSVRHDWAQDLLEWFDHYLKGTGEQPQLHAEVQDDRGHWRIHDTYPPEGTEPLELTLDQAEVTQGDGTVAGASFGTGESTTFSFGALSDDEATRIAGMPTFHPEVTPTGPGGQLFAELRDGETGQHLGHAVMDLRYHEGGDEMQPVVPGQPITAEMQFFAMDAVLPAGHPLELEVSTTGMDYLPPAVNAPVDLTPGEADALTLPTLQPSADAFFVPPGHGDELGDGVPDDAS